MRDLLVGSTGFVGGNLIKSHGFYGVCHSIDIKGFYGMKPDLCVYAGIPAAMFLANSAPERDLEIMKVARENIRRLEPEKVVLISTIAVYGNPINVDEDSKICNKGFSAYGRNRLQFERWVKEDYPDALIIRLPALYGTGLKKNFLFDLHSIVPAMLEPEKYEELSRESQLVRKSYVLESNGFYVIVKNTDRESLRKYFEKNDFNALSFTDSRSRFQFYNLNRLWQDIQIGLDCKLGIINLTTPPVSTFEVYEFVTGMNNWTNKLEKSPFNYDVKSKYSELYGGENGYLITKQEELQDIRKFMMEWK